VKIYSQNVHGIFESLKEQTREVVKGSCMHVKLEFIVKKMWKEEMDAFTYSKRPGTRAIGQKHTLIQHISPQ
jgi:hypothetical protein